MKLKRLYRFWLKQLQTIMSTSRDRRVEEVYEGQNDQRLDELHSKIRTLRGVRVHLSLWRLASWAYWGAEQVTTDIYDDAERQNLVLDDTVCPNNPFLG